MLERLRECISDAVHRYCTEGSHRDAVVAVLRRDGFALGPGTPCRAGLFVAEAYHSISGNLPEEALTGAAAIELLMEAGFLLDHLADHDPYRGNDTTLAEELALAITVLGCGVALAGEAAGHLPCAGRALHSLKRMYTNCIAACSGQLMDALLQKHARVTTDQSLKMTCLKSGSLGRLAGEFAASLATDDEEIIAGLGEFGANLFTYLQLVDDIRDAFPESGAPSDLLHRKKTLPLVYFLDSTPEAVLALDGMPPLKETPCQLSLLRRTYEASGAAGFCAIIAEAYLNRAKAQLEDLRPKLKSVDNLERLVGSLEIAPEEIRLAP